MFRIRFFFDAGSGTCFWTANEVTREKYSYPVEPDALPIDENLRREAIYLCAWRDTSIDWENPAGGSPWSQKEWELFGSKAQSFLNRVQIQLGSQYNIFDESKTRAT